MMNSTQHTISAIQKRNRTISVCGSPFTGKERDEETGYGYFGARYLDHELMTMWLSVDPMTDKYPGLSPYNYCAWNPVKLVDPDGRIIDSSAVANSDWAKIQGMRQNHPEIAYALQTLAEDNDFVYEFRRIDPRKRDNGSYILGEVITEGSTDGEGRPIILVDFSDPSAIPPEGTLYSGNNVRNRSDYSFVIAEEICHAVQVSNGELGFFLGPKGWFSVGLGLDDEISAKQFAHRVVYGNTRYPKIDSDYLLQAGYTNVSSLLNNINKTALDAYGSYNSDSFVNPSRMSRHKDTNLYIFKAQNP